MVHEACIGNNNISASPYNFSLLLARNAYPSPLNYHQFPKSCCTSVNEVICHGIPDQYVLKDGDICNIDISVFHDGFHADLNETVLVGNVDEDGKRLVQNTLECLQLAIDMGIIYDIF